MKNELKVLFFSAIFLIVLAHLSFAAEESKTRYVKTDGFRGTVFPSSYDLKFLKNYGRWDLKDEDVVKAESLVWKYLEKHISNDSRCVPKIVKERSRYKGQYFGLLGKNNDKIVWINYYYELTDSGEADNDLLVVMGGGYHFFSIKVDLAKGECFDLQINGDV